MIKKEFLTNDKSDFSDYINHIEEISYFKMFRLNNYTLEFDGTEYSLVSKENHKKYILDDFSGFLERIGLYCPIFINYDFVSSHRDEVYHLINIVLNENKPIFALGYIQEDNDENNRIIAMHSENYRILNISELISSLEFVLNAQFSDISFGRGYHSNEFTVVDYIVADNKLIKAYEKVLSDGVSFYDAKFVCRLVTSNTGHSGANMHPYFRYKTNESSDYITLPITDSKVILEHKGDASISKFVRNAESLYSLVELLPEELAKLSNIDIQYPTHCIINLAEKAGIPAKKISPIAETVSYLFAGCQPTAKELYMYLSTVINDAADEKERISLTEKVAKALKILRLHHDDVDIPKTKWKRLGIVANENQDFIPDDIDEQISFLEVA